MFNLLQKTSSAVKLGQTGNSGGARLPLLALLAVSAALWPCRQAATRRGRRRPRRIPRPVQLGRADSDHASVDPLVVDGQRGGQNQPHRPA